MTVITAQRLNKIISEQGLTKTAFAKSIGVTRNYISILTSEIYSSACVAPSSHRHLPN